MRHATIIKVVGKDERGNLREWETADMLPLTDAEVIRAAIDEALQRLVIVDSGDIIHEFAQLDKVEITDRYVMHMEGE